MSKRHFAQFGVEPGAFEARPITGALRRRRASAAECLVAADAAVAELDRGTHLFGMTRGQFSMIDLAAAVLKRTGPADVAVWTWCIAEYEVEAFGAFFHNGAVRSLSVVMDWTGAQRDMPIVAELQAKFGVDCIRVTKTHAKIVTISTDDDWRVVIRGSMNLNSNPRFEQFDVSDDPAIFGVVEGVMEELWRRGKPLPVAKLQHSDAAKLLGVEQDAGAGWSPQDGRWW